MNAHISNSQRRLPENRRRTDLSKESTSRGEGAKVVVVVGFMQLLSDEVEDIRRARYKSSMWDRSSLH